MGGRCIGRVVIAVVTTLVMSGAMSGGALAQPTEPESRHATFTATSTSTPDRAAARTSGQRFALLAEVSLGTAVVAAGFTAYWYFYKYKRLLHKFEERHVASLANSETKIDVVPWVQPQSSGVMIAGWF